MSLRWRVTLILTSLLALYVATNWAVQRFIVAPSFVALERDAARADMQRAQEALERELQHLSVICNDWAAWDDTFRWMADRNPEYLGNNLGPEPLRVANVNLVALCTLRGELVAASAFDLRTGERIALPAFAGTRLPAEYARLTALRRGSDRQMGLVLTKAGPMMLAGHPILTTNRKGPIRGVCIMGRLLGRAAVARIADQAHIDLQVHVANGAPASVRSALAGAIRPAIIEAGADQLQVYDTIPGLDGKPLLALEVGFRRDITRRGYAALRYSMLSLLGAGLLTLAVVLLAMEVLVIGPTVSLTRHVVRIGESDDLQAQLNSRRSDEIGVLTRELDRMLRDLAQARQRLSAQVYREGMAEMASGLLHNIRNMLTAIVVQVEELKADLHRARSRRLEAAVEELEAGGGAAERVRDLQLYVRLGAKGLLQTVGAGCEELESVGAQIKRMDELLCEQERASRSELRVEALEPGDLIHNAQFLLSDLTRQVLDLQVSDEQLQAAGKVRGCRAPLMLVMSNLLTNAVEAAVSHGRSQVGVRIAARREQQEGGDRVNISFSDDGPGIAPEHIHHVFERGFSTKGDSRSGRGVGLHWCANVVAASGGQMRAQSPGPGAGATFNLILPLADRGGTSR